MLKTSLLCIAFQFNDQQHFLSVWQQVQFFHTNIHVFDSFGCINCRLTINQLVEGAEEKEDPAFIYRFNLTYSRAWRQF
jgi:hypothetical protein